jgi:hypothetical protein
MYPIVFTQEKRDEQQKPVYQQQRSAPNRLLYTQINRFPEKKSSIIRMELISVLIK